MFSTFLQQFALVVGGHGYDVVHRQVAYHAGFYLYLLRIRLPFHLIACFKFFPRHHSETLEHINALCVEIALEYHGAARLAVQTAAAGFFHPLVAVSVSVEAYGFAGLYVFA